MQEDDLLVPVFILRSDTASVIEPGGPPSLATLLLSLMQPSMGYTGGASWAVGHHWIMRLIPSEAWVPSCHVLSPGEESGSIGERMSIWSLCGSGTDAAPFGVQRGKAAECRNASLLEERAWQRLCLPWVVWEEGDPGREPGGGQLTLSRWITAWGRSQPGQCRGQQQGTLSQGESRREVSAKLYPGLSCSFPTFPPMTWAAWTG